MRRVATLFTFAIAIALSARAQVQIELRPSSTVPVGAVQLAQVADIASADTVLTEQLGAIGLGAAPLPGNVRAVTRETVAMYLARAGIETRGIRWVGPTFCSVTAESHTVSSEDLIRTAEQYLRAQPLLQRAGVVIELDHTPPPRSLPADGLAPTLSATAPGITQPWGAMTVYVRIQKDGRLVASVPVTFRVTTRESAVFAKTTIRRGDVYTPDNVEAREIVLGQDATPGAYMTRLDAVIGHTATQSIAQGMLIPASAFAKPVTVRKGDGVSVVLRSEVLEITAKASCLAEGRVGDTISVRILPTGKVTTGRVNAAGEVELPL